MKRVATIILNRNLPTVTDRLVEHLKKYDDDQTDIFVVEAGSGLDMLSKYCTWHVRHGGSAKKWPAICKNSQSITADYGQASGNIGLQWVMQQYVRQFYDSFLNIIQNIMTSKFKKGE